MSKCRLTLLTAALVLGCRPPAWAAEPQFSEYSAGPLYSKPGVAPVLSDQHAKEFRTRLRAAAKSPTNFAGHYRLERWGCGTTCADGAVVDKITGRVTFVPSGGVCCTTHFPDEGETIIGRPDSSLLILVGELNEEPPDAKRFYSFDGTSFTLLKTIPFDTAPGQSAADCKAIASDVARLDCFDKASGR